MTRITDPVTTDLAASTGVGHATAVYEPSGRTRGAKRVEVRLPDEFQNRLTAYAVGAAAAGVGLLALAHPAKADIIYTPANILPLTDCCPNQTLFDLNHDGITDLRFYTAFAAGLYGTFQSALIVDAGIGVGVAAGGALKHGAVIGPAQRFSAAKVMAYRGGNFYHPSHIVSSGPWLDVRNGYLGVELPIGGQEHFGWIRLNTHGIGGTITGYAYDTVPNQAIFAGEGITGERTPESGTLGLLALGSLGVAAWRRRKQPMATDVTDKRPSHAG